VNRVFRSALALALLLVAAPAAWAQVPPVPPDLTQPPADAEKSPSGLISRVLTQGTSTEKPSATDVVTIDYTGWASDGGMFDSSIARGNPAMFPISKVFPGLRECVQLMVVSEKRRCWIPQALAYKGQKDKPTGTLVFDIELIDTRQTPTTPPSDVAAPPADATKTASGLSYKVLRPGTGVRNPDGIRRVTVHYTGWTTDGKMFDSSVSRGRPATFGLDEVIAGWTEGVQLMVVGERARFWIPQRLAYEGKAGAPSGMLVFDIELIAIRD
jgi:FKBP-type peptidyl-prolyl cis-trans isomerase